jgi:outer membrane protein
MEFFRLTALLILLLTVCIQTTAQTSVKLTLKEAEETALKNHPLVNAASLTALASDQVPKEIGAAKYPIFFASVSGADASDGARIGAGALNNPLIISRAATGVSISQLILDFGRTNRLEQSARFKANVMGQATEATRAQILLGVDRAYYLVLRGQSLLKVAEQTVSARQVVVEQIDAMRQSGLKSGLDVSIANYNLAEAKLMQARAQNELKASYAELSAALGNREEQSFELADETLPPPQTLGAPEFVREAMGKRPELKGLAFERDAAYQFVKAEKALKLPSVTGIWNAGWVPFGGSQIPTRYNAMGFSISIPIFNGRLFKAREVEAEYKARAVEETLRDAENRVTREVRLAWLNANTAYERIGLSAQLRSRATEALDLAQERYRLGLSSIVELSQAQLNVTVADIESTNAKYDYLLQRAVLNYQSGQAP